MFPFAGWEMPLQYRGIIEEHRAVRTAAGMFDVSHMGRYWIVGERAATALRRLTTYNVTALPQGMGHYSFLCREDGGILDDVYVFRPAQERFLVVANAANAEKVWGWLQSHIPPSAGLENVHLETAMIAVQGPKAVAICAAVLSPSLTHLRRRGCLEMTWQGMAMFASRTGYTGEDGLELVVPAYHGPLLWQRLLEAGVVPCGLGARDTLRLEASLPLYGQDIDESVNPLELGLTFALSLDDDADFLGREAILRAMREGPRRILACLLAEGRGIMRPGFPVLHQGQQVGTITSGGYSPMLGVSIGMAFLAPSLAQVGTRLIVDVRGRSLPVRVVRRPFYRAPREG